MDTTTNFLEVEKFYEKHSYNFAEFSTHVYDNATPKLVNVICSKEDLEGWRVTLEREHAWKPKADPVQVPVQENPFELVTALPGQEHSFVEDDGFHFLAKNWGLPIPDNIEQTINPLHYKKYITVDSNTPDMQWLEAMCRIQRYRENPDHFIAAVELQVRKYLDRNGRKDEDIKELMKGLWYYKFMVAYIKNGKNPILVKDIDNLLR